MAAGASGGRELVRGLVAAGVVLALLILGVRTMVGRMSEQAREARAGSGSTSSSPVPARPASPVPTTPASTTPVPGTPVPAGPVPATPVPASPVPASPVPAPATAVPLSPFPAPPPPLTVAPPATDVPVHHGTLDAVAVRGVVREALPEIRFCFEWQLNAHPDLAGRVTMQFTIQEDGSVTEASVLEDELNDETVTRCFTHVMANLRFPPPEGGSVEVHYPFSLTGAPEAREPEGI